MTLSPTSADAAAADAVRFRPSKRRKTYRQRTDDDDGSGSGSGSGSGPGERGSGAPVPVSPGQQPPAPSEGSDADEESAVVVAAVRARSARRGRLRGVGFASGARGGVGPAAAADRDGDEEAVVGGIAERFTHQTGLIADVSDRHMTAYIESRLSSRNAPPDTHRPTATGSAPRSAAPGAPAAAEAAAKTGEQPTKHGRLLEVEVPEDQRLRRDDAKQRRTETPAKSGRGRNRRGSDDVKRDQLVEQFLHENRLDVYDVPSQSAAPPSPTPGDDRTADDRMAEQFRRQYLDELAQRRQRRRHAHPPRQPKPVGDVLKGPKLGGSRNSRAAVRDMLLKQEKEKAARRP